MIAAFLIMKNQINLLRNLLSLKYKLILNSQIFLNLNKQTRILLNPVIFNEIQKCQTFKNKRVEKVIQNL